VEKVLLLGCKGCGNVIVESALALAGVPFDYEEVDYSADSPTRERLLAVNPLGQVPALVLPPGKVMTESLAMLHYIDDLAPQAGLIPPRGDPARADFYRWAVFLVAAVYPTYTYGDDAKKWVAGDTKAAEALRARLAEVWPELEIVAEAKNGLEAVELTRTHKPDLVFLDNTDWSVVQPNGFPDYRYNDRELVRAFADKNVAAYDWLLAHGVVFADKAPDSFGGTSIGNSVPREMHAVPMHWIIAQTGEPEPATTAATRSTGNDLMRPLEAAARKVGVEILLEHRMTAIHREFPGAGRVTGIQAVHKGNVLDIRARKAVIIATGGHTGNVEFRRQFDPRLT
jgi:glutathione S-transferase